LIGEGRFPRPMPHLPDTSGILSLNSPLTTITFIPRNAGLSLGRLPSVVKIRNTGREEPVCSGEPQKRLTSLAKSLKTRPPHLYPETPLKRPPNKPKILCSNSLDTQLPSQYTPNTQKRVLIKDWSQLNTPNLLYSGRDDGIQTRGSKNDPQKRGLYLFRCQYPSWKKGHRR